MSPTWRHVSAALLAVVAASLVVAAAAVADAEVKLRSSNLSIVATPAGPAAQNLVVEPYSDAVRIAGFRVRPPIGESSGPITASDGCVRNPIVNDVVCGGQRDHVGIDLGARGGNDDVVVRESQTDRSFTGTCASRSNPRQGGVSFGLTVKVVLANGDDFFRVHPQPAGWCRSGRAAVGVFYALVVTEVEVLGGNGDDEIWGFLGNDILNGGTGNDDVEGSAGNDTLELGGGNDNGIGGPGNDSIQGASGNDAIQGEDGNDVLTGSSGNDTIDGGPGSDTISGGEGDDLLRGGPGGDSVTGHDGDDTIWAGDDADPTRAVPVPNEAACNSGYDTAYVGPEDNTIQCERIFRFFPGDGLPSYATETTLYLTRGATGVFTGALAVRCPAQAVVRCTGTMRVTPDGSGTVLAQASYDLAVGQERTFGLNFPEAPPNTVVARTSEQGQTAQRSSLVTLGVVKSKS